MTLISELALDVYKSFKGKGDKTRDYSTSFSIKLLFSSQKTLKHYPFPFLSFNPELLKNS